LTLSYEKPSAENAGGFPYLKTMRIEKNKVASIFYTVKESKTDKVLQLIPEDQPQEFLFGHDLLLDIFESELVGLSEGDSFKFDAKAEQAYGPIDPSAIFDLPLNTFTEEDGQIDDEVVQVGHVFPMEDKEGNRHYGKIIRKMKDRVTMDFNHPMAGKNLTFEGKVVAVRAARQEEIPLPKN
jgi:FKBP-type peptidyl-prolyl cis-trans isomerase SlyD